MSKLIAIFFALLSLFRLQPSTPGRGLPEGAVLSESILLSINYPGAGYGTPAMCADAEVYLYKDGTIRITVPAEFAPAAIGAAIADEAGNDADIVPDQGEVTIATLQMSQHNYDRVAAFASPERIARLQVREDWDVCDGTSYFITLYTDAKPNPVPILKKGGYMPIGDEFWEVYSYIHARLNLYDVYQLVEEWRQGAIENE